MAKEEEDQIGISHRGFGNYLIEQRRIESFFSGPNPRVPTERELDQAEVMKQWARFQQERGFYARVVKEARDIPEKHLSYLNLTDVVRRYDNLSFIGLRYGLIEIGDNPNRLMGGKEANVFLDLYSGRFSFIGFYDEHDWYNKLESRKIIPVRKNILALLCSAGNTCTHGVRKPHTGVIA